MTRWTHGGQHRSVCASGGHLSVLRRRSMTVALPSTLTLESVNGEVRAFVLVCGSVTHYTLDALCRRLYRNPNEKNQKEKSISSAICLQHNFCS